MLEDNTYANVQYEGFCTTLPTIVLQATELCALPHYLDDMLGPRIIHEFAGLNGASEAAWAEVKRLPFVYPYEEGAWRFAAEARAYFVSRLEKRNGVFLELNRYLKDHFESERKGVSDSDAPKARELDWRVAYHLAPLAPQDAVSRALKLGADASRTNRLADLKSVVDLFQQQAQWLGSYQVERSFSEGCYAYAKHDYTTAEACFRTVLQHSRADHITAIAAHLLGVIWAERDTNDWLAQAEKLFRQSLAIGVELKLAHHQAMVMNSLGGVLVRLGGEKRFLEAEKLFRQSLAIGVELKLAHHQAMVMNSLGGVLVRLGGKKRFLEAEKLFRQSLAMLEGLDDLHGQAMVMNSLGGVLVRLGGEKRLAQAEKLFRQSLAIGVELKLAHHQAMVMNSLGGVLVRLGGEKRFLEAEKICLESLAMLRDLGDRRGQAIVLNSLATVKKEQGDIERACDYIEQVILINDELGYKKNSELSRKRLDAWRSLLGK